ncbi:hypothetical protein HanPSC8_Chr14g0620631 [Helianthus annuus]|nr:hypothetical protein HanPSC8_Chr14g0620631 [Helianthus annuus]
MHDFETSLNFIYILYNTKMETYHWDRSEFLTLTNNFTPSFLKNDLTNGLGVIPLPR